jgi:hypothetical protein
MRVKAIFLTVLLVSLFSCAVNAQQEKPDLNVTRMWFYEEKFEIGEKNRVLVSVVNEGLGKAPQEVSGMFFINGLEVKEVVFPEEWNHTQEQFAWIDFTPRKPGNFSVVFKVDSNGTVEEENEENNEREVSFQVAGVVSTPTNNTNSTVNETVGVNATEKPVNETQGNETALTPGQPVQEPGDQSNQQFSLRDDVMIAGAMVFGLLIIMGAFWFFRKPKNVKEAKPVKEEAGPEEPGS